MVLPMTQPNGAGEALRFTRITLDNWRNFRSVDIELQRRMFLVGPNASGKSNILDAFRFLRDIVAIGGGFQDAVGKRGGVSRIRCLAARKDPQIGIRVDIGSDASPKEWSYELRFTQDPRRRRPIVRKEIVEHRGVTVHSRPNAEDQSDPERLTQTALEQVTANREFRPIADFFASVRYLHLVPQLVREPDRSIGRENDPFGGDFLEQVARAPKKQRDSRLAKITRALRVAVPQLEELRLEIDERGTWHLRGRYQHWRPKGAWQDESDFSDGTLRLIGLLWSLLDRGGPLLLEEPELSLHPEVVRRVPQIFARIQRESGRQILVSTHSVDLLRDTGIGLDETLMLIPGDEGTEVRRAADVDEIVRLLQAGLSMAEAVMPRTRPASVDQLALF